MIFCSTHKNVSCEIYVCILFCTETSHICVQWLISFDVILEAEHRLDVAAMVLPYFYKKKQLTLTEVAYAFFKIVTPDRISEPYIKWELSFVCRKLA